MLVALAALCAGCRGGASAIEKTVLTRLPPRYLANSIVVSHDGKAFAFVEVTDDGRHRVVSSHGTGEVHEECSKVAFAPKSDRVFYWTRDGGWEHPTIAMVADGTPVPTSFVATGEMVFSADGSRWFGGGVARRPADGTLGEITMFVDGAPVAHVTDPTLPVFSADGRRFAYLTATERRVSLVVDGTVQRTFEPPTAECGAAALRSAPELDLPLRHLVQFLPDGSLLVATRDREGWGVYIGDTRVASYARANFDLADEQCARTSAFVPRSLRVAEQAPAAFWWERVAGDAELWRVVRNGRPVDAITCIEPWLRHPPEPSRDGEHVTYACATAGPDDIKVVFIVKDGMRYGAYDDVWGIAPTKNGEHVAYGAALGSGERPWRVYVDGQLRVDKLLGVWRPRLAEDGTALAWQASLEETNRGFFGIDGRRLATFDQVLWGPEFLPGDRVGWVIRRGRKLTRITVPIASRDRPRRE